MDLGQHSSLGARVRKPPPPPPPKVPIGTMMRRVVLRYHSRFLVGLTVGGTTLWLLLVRDHYHHRYPFSYSDPAEDIIKITVVSAFVGLGVGLIGLALIPLIRFGWKWLCRKGLPKVLGVPVEEPLRDAIAKPFVRVLTAVFVIAWIAKAFVSEGSLAQAILPATWSGSVAVLTVLGVVVLWKLAHKDQKPKRS